MGSAAALTYKLGHIYSCKPKKNTPSRQDLKKDFKKTTTLDVLRLQVFIRVSKIEVVS
jgi:predicted HD phosphohydrolase